MNYNETAQRSLDLSIEGTEELAKRSGDLVPSNQVRYEIEWTITRSLQSIAASLIQMNLLKAQELEDNNDLPNSYCSICEGVL